MKYDAVFVLGTFAIGIGFGRMPAEVSPLLTPQQTVVLGVALCALAVVLSAISAIRKVRREERERKARGEVVTTIQEEKR